MMDRFIYTICVMDFFCAVAILHPAVWLMNKGVSLLTQARASCIFYFGFALLYASRHRDFHGLWVYALVTVAMWLTNKSSTNNELAHWIICVCRVMCVGFGCGLLSADFYFYHHPDLLTCAHWAFTYHYYVSYVKHDDEDKKKKSRLSWDKVKELFGTGWMVEPLPEMS